MILGSYIRRREVSTMIDWSKRDWSEPGTAVRHSESRSWWDATEERHRVLRARK
jgi:hypothetical protein